MFTIASKHMLLTIDKDIKKNNVDKKKICLILDEVDAVVGDGLFQQTPVPSEVGNQIQTMNNYSP